VGIALCCSTRKDCFSVKPFSILVVDDDEMVCTILGDLFRREGYTTTLAHNGKEALERIEELAPDMVISDIQMPVMDGFELFGILDSRYPAIKHVMMTGYDIDQYIRNIRKHNIGNILVKGSDFNLVEVAAYVRSLLTGDIFGLRRYFDGGNFEQVNVRSYAQAKEVYHQIIHSADGKAGFFLEVAIDELISNAIFHGVLEYSQVPREEWSEDVEIPAEDAIKVTWGSDDEKIAVSVEDPKGNLKKHDVLKWLDTPRTMDNGEEHGRGFLLVRRLIDRLVINIDPGKRTECIIVQNKRKTETEHNKPLLIHEL
jgi:CheY-like chemotaxis protein